MPITFGGQPCVDPRQLARTANDRHRPITHWYGQANLVKIGLGREAGTATLLMLRKHLDILLTSSDQILEFRDQKNNTFRAVKLAITSAAQIDPGADRDPEAVLLVKASDPRWMFCYSTLNRAYNLRSGAGANDYLRGSMDTTTSTAVAWTWATMCQDIWQLLPGGFVWPGLPFTPNGRPENWSFFVTNAWDSLNDVLDRLQCAVGYNWKEGTFFIRRLGANPPATADKVGRLWDSDPLEPGRIWRPEKVVVWFRRQEAPTDGSSPYFKKEITSPGGFPVQVGTEAQIHDDLVAIGPATGTPTNDSALQTRAQERATDYLRVRQVFTKPQNVVYRLIKPIAPERIGADLGTIAVYDRGEGMCTEVREGKPVAWVPPFEPSEVPASHFARLTGRVGKRYSHVEVVSDPTKLSPGVANPVNPATWITKPGGITGNYIANPAWQVDGSENLTLNTVVWLRYDTEGNNGWITDKAPELGKVAHITLAAGSGPFYNTVSSNAEGLQAWHITGVGHTQLGNQIVLGVFGILQNSQPGWIFGPYQRVISGFNCVNGEFVPLYRLAIATNTEFS